MTDKCPKCGAPVIENPGHVLLGFECETCMWPKAPLDIIESRQCFRNQIEQANARIAELELFLRASRRGAERAEVEKDRLGEGIESLAAERIELAATVENLLAVCRNSLGAYKALRACGVDNELPGYDDCLARLKAAIADAEKGNTDGVLATEGHLLQENDDG